MVAIYRARRMFSLNCLSMPMTRGTNGRTFTCNQTWFDPAPAGCQQMRSRLLELDWHWQSHHHAICCDWPVYWQSVLSDWLIIGDGSLEAGMW